MWKFLFFVSLIYSSLSFATQEGQPEIINCLSEDHKEFQFVIEVIGQNKSVYKAYWDNELFRTGVLTLKDIDQYFFNFQSQGPEAERIKISVNGGKSYFSFSTQYTRWDSWRRPHVETHNYNYDMICSWN